MRIVVFSLNFPPLRNPRSFRVGLYSKYLHEKYDLLTITSSIDEECADPSFVFRSGIKIRMKSKLRGKLKRFSVIRFFHKFIFPDDRIIYMIPFLFNYIFKLRRKDDLIMTVSNPISAHLIGIFLKLFFRHQWIVDIGDIFSNQNTSNNGPNAFLINRYEKSVLNFSDHVVLNAYSLKQYYQSSFSIPNEKMTVIPNGILLDIERIRHIQSNEIRLSFIGNTYPIVREGLEEMKILLKLVELFPETTILIQLYGVQFSKLHELENIFPNIIKIRYCQTDDELIQAYSNTDILINFANKDNPGLPSKLNEYQATGIPIINFLHSFEDSSWHYLNTIQNAVIHVLVNQVELESIAEFITKSLNVPRIHISEPAKNFTEAWNRVFNKFIK
ncbi:MAG: glycosyltransferase [Saprospiraceae bacterium]